MPPPISYPIGMLPALTGRSLARCVEIVEAGLVRTLEVPFGDKAKDDSGRRKAVLVPAGRVRSISQIPEGEIAVDPAEDEADRIARIAIARANEAVRVRRMKDSSFAGFEVEVPVFASIFPVERETLLGQLVHRSRWGAMTARTTPRHDSHPSGDLPCFRQSQSTLGSFPLDFALTPKAPPAQFEWRLDGSSLSRDTQRTFSLPTDAIRRTADNGGRAKQSYGPRVDHRT